MTMASSFVKGRDTHAHMNRHHVIGRLLKMAPLESPLPAIQSNMNAGTIVKGF